MNDNAPAHRSQLVKEFLAETRIKSLEDEIMRRFQDFKKIMSKLNLPCYTLTTHIDTTPEKLQLELIDLKSDQSRKKILWYPTTFRAVILQKRING
ncbi:hypothetical protein TNCV_2279271 [Trichonephila clavipes]|uniref:Uncharacterized protein n=1 Tax=Trichonephila clavipes TaxID=2585209 RepID=A0A8X6R997_TRICX|nr:hypothetical protein TNCV_2279271 [Trichonephila clavipes]